MCAASGRTNYRYGNQERCFVHDKLSHKKVAKESDSTLPNTEFGLCAETKQHWWDMKGYNVVTGAVSLRMLQRLVQWDPASMLTRQTGWCCMMSSREHNDGFTTLFWIGFTRRKKTQKGPFVKMAVAALHALAARQRGICPTAPPAPPPTCKQTHNSSCCTNKHASKSEEDIPLFFYLFFFKWGKNKRKNAKMKRCVPSSQAPSAPFHAGSLRNINSRFSASGKQTKTNEYLIFSKHFYLPHHHLCIFSSG